MNKDEFMKELIEVISLSIINNGDTMLAINNKYKEIANIYDQCDDEMKEIYDNHIKTIIKASKEKNSRMEDSISKRQHSRLIDKVEGKDFKIKDIINSLNIKPLINDVVIKKADELFYKHSENITNLISDIIRDNNDLNSSDILIISLYCYLIEELIIAKKLIDHNYCSQSYSHLRSIFETLDLIDFFIKDSSYIELWENNNSNDKEIQDEKRKTFMPSNVRKIIGKKDSIYEKIYWTLCEVGTHPTSKNIKSRLVITSDEEVNKIRKVSIKIGGTPFREQSKFTNAILLQTISFILINLISNFNSYFLGEEINQILDNTKIEIKDFYSNYLIDDLKKMGFNIDELVDILNN